MLSCLAGWFLSVAAAAAPAEVPVPAQYQGIPAADALVSAARAGDVAVLETLLAAGAEINGIAALRGERTALNAAVAADQLAAVHYLVAQGADLNLRAEKVDPPLLVAWKRGTLWCADALVQAGAVAEPLPRAAARGDVEALVAGEVFVRGDFDELKLLAEIAAANGQAELYDQLAGLILKLPGHSGWEISNTAVTITAARGHRPVLEVMIRRDSQLHRNGVRRLATAVAENELLRTWLNEQKFEVPEAGEGEQLIDAAEVEDVPALRGCLARGASVDFQGESGWTALTKAAAWGCPKAVRFLLEKKANPQIPKSPGWDYSALCLAKTPEIADLLLAAGADLNATLFQRGIHIMDYATWTGSNSMLKWFLDHGVDPVKVHTDEPTLLFDAVTPEAVEMLAARGVPLEARDKSGRTALVAATQHSRPAPIIAALLKAGADPNAWMDHGITALMLAPDGPSVEALVAAGADLQARTDDGRTVVSYGADRVEPSRLEALHRHAAQAGPDVAASLLLAAIAERQLGQVRRLLQAGVDPSYRPVPPGVAEPSPQAEALALGEFEIAQALRDAGAQDVGRLAAAAARGDLSQAEALLAAGAEINEATAFGQTPLHFAALNLQVSAVHFLLERGAQAGRFDARGRTPALAALNLLVEPMAARRGKPEAELDALRDELVKLLHERNDGQYRGAQGETALLCALRTKLTVTIEALLAEPGLDVNAQREDGMSALMLAASASLGENERNITIGLTEPGSGKALQFTLRGYLVYRLLTHGADPTLRNRAGRSALDLARDRKDVEVQAMLEKTQP